MDKRVDYGERLSGEEYDRRVVALHENLPPTLSPEEEKQVRRRELDAMIDYRLGRDFPKEKRNQLWKIQERIEKKRLSLMLKYLFRHLFRKNFLQSTQNLAGYLVDEYAEVLSREELESFFGKEEVDNPALPVNNEHF